jgi:hypothetical protein
MGSKVKKMYSDGSEYVYDQEWWMQTARDTGSPIIVEGTKRERGGDMMWCTSDGNFVYSVDCCGRQCSNYSPCNGKNGRCRKLTQGFVGTGVKYKITEKGGIRKVIR